MFVVYSSNDEVLVTTRKNEKAMLLEWFAPHTGRDLDDYDREESKESAIQISADMRARC